MKILITGGSSLLGKSLIETAPEDTNLALTRKKNIHAITPHPWYYLDIKDRSSVFEVFEIVRPDIVIHCAALGSVNYAEREGYYQQVFDVNVTGTGNVIDAANGYKSKVVYISTNAVFSGEKPPYNENSLLEPVNAYGIIKKHAEQLIRDTANKWLIVRPFLLYGWPFAGGRTNWASAIYEKMANGGGFKLVADHTWMPTYAPDCADAIWKLLYQFDNEIFNVASPERATLYEFGLKVCKVFGFNENLIRPIQSDYFPSIAKRPRDTSYDLIKLTKADIVLNDIKTGLEKMKETENEDNR